MPESQRVIIVGSSCFGMSTAIELRRRGWDVSLFDPGHAFKFTPVLGKIIADVLECKPNQFALKFARRHRGELSLVRMRIIPAV